MRLETNCEWQLPLGAKDNRCMLPAPFIVDRTQRQDCLLYLCPAHLLDHLRIHGAEKVEFAGEWTPVGERENPPGHPV